MALKPKPLAYIEKCWTGPMANTVHTRVRFAMWDAMRLAVSLSRGNCRKAIKKALNDDMALFDQYGQGDRKN